MKRFVNSQALEANLNSPANFSVLLQEYRRWRAANSSRYPPHPLLMGFCLLSYYADQLDDFSNDDIDWKILRRVRLCPLFERELTLHRLSVKAFQREELLLSEYLKTPDCSDSKSSHRLHATHGGKVKLLRKRAEDHSMVMRKCTFHNKDKIE